jgi:hypothetical protein
MMKAEWTAVIAAVLMLLGLIGVALSVVDRAARRTQENGGKFVRASPLEALGLLLAALGLLALMIIVMIRGWFWLFQVPFHLMVGWLLYLDRVLREVRPDAATVASAIVCLVAASVGVHVFLRWLAAAWAVSWSAKRTLRLLLLVGLLFASGVAVVGMVQQTGWLIRTPEPLLKDNRQIS